MGKWWYTIKFMGFQNVWDKPGPTCAELGRTGSFGKIESLIFLLQHVQKQFAAVRVSEYFVQKQYQNWSVSRNPKTLGHWGSSPNMVQEMTPIKIRFENLWSPSHFGGLMQRGPPVHQVLQWEWIPRAKAVVLAAPGGVIWGPITCSNNLGKVTTPKFGSYYTLLYSILKSSRCWLKTPLGPPVHQVHHCNGPNESSFSLVSCHYSPAPRWTPDCHRPALQFALKKPDSQTFGFSMV